MTEFTLLFGLSADPVHAGHVETVVQAYQCLCKMGFPVVRVLLMPAYRRNPVGARKSRLPATFTARYAMCALAAYEIGQRLGLPPQVISASDLEARLARGRCVPNYTAETLTLLKLRTAPNAGLIFLLSSELVAGKEPQFGQWYQPQIIAQLALLAIVPRPGYNVNRRFLSALRQRRAQVIVLDNVRTPDVSSSEIRRQLQHGGDVAALVLKGLLTPLVARFLLRHPLYSSCGGKGEAVGEMGDGHFGHGLPLRQCRHPSKGQQRP